MEFSEVDAALCSALSYVLTGNIEPGVATAASSIARTIVTVRTVTDLEKRLERLETEVQFRELA
jgi:hypothetical protein